MSKPKAIVVDLDNTLALIGDRDPYAGHLCASDALCEATALVVFAVAEGASVNVIFLTGRNEAARDETATWLLRHLAVAAVGGSLIMRAVDDWRPSDVYKLDMLDTRILPEYDVVFALDDDPKVVRAFRDRGIVCWHVRDWVEHPVKCGETAA
jgi:hypothetical protein